jgi:hypothetical protein
MLQLIAARHPDSVAPKRVTYSFQQTMTWQRFVDTASQEGEEGGTGSQQLLDQLWLRPQDCVPVYYEAILRHLLLQGVSLDKVDADDLREAEDEFRESRGLDDDEEFTAWLERNSLTRAKLSELLSETVVMRGRLQGLTGYRGRLWDLLRLTGMAEQLNISLSDNLDVDSPEFKDLAAEALAELRIALLDSEYAPLNSAFMEFAYQNWDVFVQALVRSRKSKL